MCHSVTNFFIASYFNKLQCDATCDAYFFRLHGMKFANRRKKFKSIISISCLSRILGGVSCVAAGQRKIRSFREGLGHLPDSWRGLHIICRRLTANLLGAKASQFDFGQKRFRSPEVCPLYLWTGSMPKRAAGEGGRGGLVAFFRQGAAADGGSGFNQQGLRCWLAALRDEDPGREWRLQKGYLSRRASFFAFKIGLSR